MGIWDINKITSITIFSENIRQGLMANGHHVETFFFSMNKTKASNPYNYDHAFLIDNKDERISAFKIIKDFDHFIFTFPCPNINKNYTSTNWMKIVATISKFCKVHVFVHEVWVERAMGWFRKVIPFVENLIAPQYSAYDSFKEEFGEKKKINLRDEIVKESFSEYVNQNRVDGVYSKHGKISDKREISKYIN
jgi:hypothetical protein